MIISNSYKIIKKYLVHPMYTLKYINFFYKRKFKAGVKFLSDEQCLKQMVNSQKSLIRLGDGEIGLLFGDDIRYQQCNKELKEYMWTIINNYTKKSKYILAIPKFLNIENMILKEQGRLRIWMPFKLIFYYYFNKDVKYGNAHIFYKHNLFEEKIISKYKNKLIIVISNKKNISKTKYWQVGDGCILRKVTVPSKNAFDSLDFVKSRIDKIMDTSNVAKKDVLLLPAMGPAAKVLIYEYSKHNIQGYDLGQGIEYFFIDSHNTKILKNIF